MSWLAGILGSIAKALFETLFSHFSGPKVTKVEDADPVLDSVKEVSSEELIARFANTSDLASTGDLT